MGRETATEGSDERLPEWKNIFYRKCVASKGRNREKREGQHALVNDILHVARGLSLKDRITSNKYMAAQPAAVEAHYSTD